MEQPAPCNCYVKVRKTWDTNFKRTNYRFLDMAKIFKWREIKDEFRDGLILGNGASIAIDERFDYSSLYEEASIKDDVRDVFCYAKTYDFELVLKMLHDTKNVNKFLGIKDKKTKPAYRNLRDALIKTVKKIHPPYDDVSFKLKSYAEFMKNFKIVVSLNYDLLVYWTMLAANRRGKKHSFKDCFYYEGRLVDNWQDYREPYGRAKKTTLVFFQHGNLVLATDQYGEECKISQTGYKNLLETVFDKWKSEDYIPLFVSEGTNKQKRRAIHRSHYLNVVYGSVFRDLGQTLVIYGWSMKKKDVHILKTIGKIKGLKSVAVSVHTSLRNHKKCQDVKSRLRKVTENKKLQVKFFDAESAGKWAKP